MLQSTESSIDMRELLPIIQTSTKMARLRDDPSIMDTLLASSEEKAFMRLVSNAFLHQSRSIIQNAYGWQQATESRTASALTAVADKVGAVPLIGDAISSILTSAASLHNMKFQAMQADYADLVQRQFLDSELVVLSHTFAYYFTQAFKQHLPLLTIEGQNTLAKEGVTALLTTLLDSKESLIIPESDDPRVRIAGAVKDMMAKVLKPWPSKLVRLCARNTRLETRDKQQRCWTLPGILSKAGVVVTDEQGKRHYYTRPKSRPKKYGFIEVSADVISTLGFEPVAESDLPEILSSPIFQRQSRDSAEVVVGDAPDSKREPSVIGQMLDRYLEEDKVSAADLFARTQSRESMLQELGARLSEHDRMARLFNDRVSNIRHHLAVTTIHDREAYREDMQYLERHCQFEEEMSARMIPTLHLIEDEQQIQETLERVTQQIADMRARKLGLLTHYLNVVSQDYHNHPEDYDDDPDVMAFVHSTELETYGDSDFAKMIADIVPNAAFDCERMKFQFHSDSVTSFDTNDYFNSEYQFRQEAYNKDHKAQLMQNIWQKRARIQEISNKIEEGASKPADMQRRLDSVKRQKIKTAIALYIDLGGQTIGPMALSNHNSFIDGCARAWKSTFKSFYRSIRGFDDKEAFKHNLHDPQGREAFVSQLVQSDNINSVESYWVRAIHSLIERHPKETVKMIMRHYHDSALIQEYFPKLVEKFPPKRQAELREFASTQNIDQVKATSLEHK